MWIEFEGDWMTAVWETAQGARRTAIDMQNTRASTQALGWWGSNGQQEIKWSWKITIFNGKILEKSTINGHLGDLGATHFVGILEQFVWPPNFDVQRFPPGIQMTVILWGMPSHATSQTIKWNGVMICWRNPIDRVSLLPWMYIWIRLVVVQNSANVLYFSHVCMDVAYYLLNQRTRAVDHAKDIWKMRKDCMAVWTM
jgi:hypothetical protein